MSFLKQPQTCANSAPPPNRCPAASTRSASPCRGAPCGRPPHRPNVCPPRGACPSLHPLTTAVPSPCGRPSPSSQKRASNQKRQHLPRALPPQFPCPSLHRSPTNQSPSLALSSPQIPVQTTDHCCNPGSPDPLPNLDRFPRFPPIHTPYAPLLVFSRLPPLSSPCGGIWPVLAFFILGLGSRIPYTFPASQFCPAMSEARHSTSARAS